MRDPKGPHGCEIGELRCLDCDRVGRRVVLRSVHSFVQHCPWRWRLLTPEIISQRWLGSKTRNDAQVFIHFT